jgi:hypothetical protein
MCLHPARPKESPPVLVQEKNEAKCIAITEKGTQCSRSANKMYGNMCKTHGDILVAAQSPNKPEKPKQLVLKEGAEEKIKTLIPAELFETDLEVLANVTTTTKMSAKNDKFTITFELYKK